MTKNYLWQAAGKERRVHQRFKCQAVVRLVYKPSTQKPLVSLRAVVVDISRGGARLRVAAKEVPDHFYIVLGQFEYAIGCVKVRTVVDEISVEFIKEQPLRLIEAFALLSFPMAPYLSLGGLLKNDVTVKPAAAGMSHPL
jgi:hypothetical protein